jgi:hypothetical protein
LHSFVDNQCCTALSHLQHEAEIPNCWRQEMAGIANSGVAISDNTLKTRRFEIWHGSCSVKGRHFATE